MSVDAGESDRAQELADALAQAVEPAVYVLGIWARQSSNAVEYARRFGRHTTMLRGRFTRASSSTSSMTDNCSPGRRRST